MKIGIDVRLWSETGVGRYIRNLMYELQKQDKRNKYILFCRSGDIDVIKSAVSSFHFSFVIADIPWHTLSEQMYFPRLIQKQKVDLMHFPYFSIPFWYKDPFVVTIHDLITYHFPTGKASTLPHALYYLKYISYRFVINSAIQNSRKIIVPLACVKEDVLSTFKIDSDKVIITEEGFDPSLQVNKDIENHIMENIKEAPYFLYVGNAYPHKNVDFLLSTFLEFNRNKNFKLILIGKNDYFYKQLEEKYNNDKAIYFYHNVSDSVLASYYTHAQALICPSFLEGFGLPALEAMALSCPVVVSEIPAFKEVCQDAAYYCDPYSKASLLLSLQKIERQDKKEINQKIKKGRERASCYSWVTMVEKTIKLYESCNSV